MPPSTDSAPTDLLRIDDQLNEEERLVRDTVRAFAADRIMPHIADWFEAGTLPRELAPELGKLGLLGMHLKGYGCAGMGPVAYGVTCREMEAADSGLRSLVSVQGSLAMFPIWKYGSEEQKQEWLPRMAAGEAIGCFGLTEPDHGSDPSSMTTHAEIHNGNDWILSGTKMWITNGSIADIAVVWAQTPDGIRGFLVPRGARGFTASNIHKKLSLRASVTSELHFDEVRLPADAVLPGVTGLKGPLSCLSEARYGILWGVTGAARSCYVAAAEYARTREQFGRKIGGFQLTQAKLAWMLADLSRAQLLALHLGRLKEAGKITPEQVSLGKMANVRTAIDIARQARTVLGANGITLEYPVIRHANNLESVLTYEGTEEIHTLALGQAITGISAYR
jgi:glutaryl-CoA dehydrogenase